MNETENTGSDVARDVRLSPCLPTKRWPVRLMLFFLIFVCGVVTGVGLSIRYIQKDRFPGIATPDPDSISEKIWHKYDMDEERHQSLRGIVRRHFAKLETIRESVYPHFADTLDAYEDDIAELLPESQRPQWRRDFQHIREKVFSATTRTGPANGSAKPQ